MTGSSLFVKHIRNNPPVSRIENRLGCFNKSSFYKNELKLNGNKFIANAAGEIIAIHLRGILTLSAVMQAEQYLEHVSQVLGTKYINNSRGKYRGFLVGLIKESGGKGWIRYHNRYKGFLRSTLLLRSQVEDVIMHIAPNFARMSDHIPGEFITCKPFTSIFCNLTPTYVSHVDARDGEWTAIAPMGPFRKGSLELTYMNTRIRGKRGDLVVLHHSNEVYHKVVEADINRWSLVFSQHTCILKSDLSLFHY